MAYSELIKDINKIRSFIRDFYVFGFYTREEYAALYQISPRSYDNERRRVESWMQEYLTFYQNSAGRKVFLSVDGNNILHNPLYRVFKAKSFTANDALLHFYLMDLFADGKTVEQAEIADLLAEEYCGIFGEDWMPDMKTIRLKLKDLTELGLLMKEKDKRSTRYRIVSEDADLSLPGVWDALNFFSEEAPLGVIGSFLLDKRSDTGIDIHCFRFRHHYLMQAVDSEILSELLLSIDEKRFIRMRVDNAVQGSVQYVTLPIRIFVSTENGRQYLLSWNDELKRFFFTRIDRIIWVMLLEKAPLWDVVMDQFQLHQKALWGVSFGGLEEVKPVVHLEMEITAGEKETFIVRRLEREKRCGTVAKTGPDRYLFRADVYDAMEMLPWICTFTGRIIRLECDDPDVIRKYGEYLTKMAEVYFSDVSRKNKDEGEEQTRDSFVKTDKDPASADDTGSTALGFRPIMKGTADQTIHSVAKKAGSSKDRHDLVFHEVYGAYYNALARILAMAVRGELTPGKLYAAVQDKAFGESGIYLPDRLLSGEWPFLTEDLETELKNEPSMPLTHIQKRWLKSLLEDSRIRLFLDDETCRTLSGQLETVRPLYTEDTFCYFDRFSDGDPYQDPVYIMHFRTVLSAIRQQKGLSVFYQNQYGQSREMQVIPLFIEYSAREDKFRLHALHMGDIKRDEPLRLNIGRICSCEMLSDHGNSQTKTKTRRESVVLELIDQENTLERAMFLFSFLEKKTERLDSGKYRITLYYAKTDETEILIRILSFGHQLEVVSQGSVRGEIRSRLLSQKNHPVSESLPF